MTRCWNGKSEIKYWVFCHFNSLQSPKKCDLLDRNCAFSVNGFWGGLRGLVFEFFKSSLYSTLCRQLETLLKFINSEKIWIWKNIFINDYIYYSISYLQLKSHLAASTNLKKPLIRGFPFTQWFQCQSK